jgi:hypothetical protein
MFSGGAPANADSAPRRAPAPQERTFANQRRSGGRPPSDYRMKLERLRMAREPDELREAVDAFLANHQLPDEPEVLTKVLQHPSEKVAREAMGQISALLMQGRMVANVLLDERLKELEGRATEAATRSYIQGIQAQLASLRK